MRHLDDGAVAATVRSMVGCRCLSIRQLSVLLPEPWQSPQGLIRPYWLFTVSLPPAALCIYTWYAIASSITCLDILLNGQYLYLWLYVDSCFTPCKYQSIKYYYYYYPLSPLGFFSFLLISCVESATKNLIFLNDKPYTQKKRIK